MSKKKEFKYYRVIFAKLIQNKFKPFEIKPGSQVSIDFGYFPHLHQLQDTVSKLKKQYDDYALISAYPIERPTWDQGTTK